MAPPPSESTDNTDKPKDNKAEVPTSPSVSQQALDPKDPNAGTAGRQTATTDRVPTAQVTDDYIDFGGQQPRPSDKVKTDDKGHVTEVELPNNQKRSFTYDDKGQLNSITEPGGKKYELKDGKWVGPDGKPANIESASVSAQGDLVYRTSDRHIITRYADGRSDDINLKNNAVTTTDANNRVTQIHYGNGQSRQFGYDNDGNMNRVTETNGDVYEKRGDKWFGPDGKETFTANPNVLSDGTYSYRTPDGRTISIDSNAQTSMINLDGSVMKLNDRGLPTEITYTDGQHRQFEYDKDNHVTKIVNPDGSAFTLQGNQWIGPDGKPAKISDVSINDGMLRYRDGNDWHFIGTNDKDMVVNIDQMRKAAEEIHDAKDHKWGGISIFGAGFDDPDKDKIWNIVEPMSAEQRQILLEEYQKKYGKSLLDEVGDKFGKDGADYARLEALFKRKDGVADNTGTIHEALAKLRGKGENLTYYNEPYLDDTQVRSEKEIRDALNTLTADQLRAVEAKYRQDYGRDLQEDLLNSKDISNETKEALKIYFKGNDHITDDDRLRLANMAIDKHRPDIFNEVFRDASQTARDRFIADNGYKKIEDAFDGGDEQISKDYLERGCVSIATIVRGDTHWYHTNKDDITRAMEHATEQDRRDFELGESIKLGGRKPANADEQRALDFYNNVDNALHGAGNDREVALWEAKLRDNESVIKNILESRDDGGWFGWGAHTDKNKLYGAVENMSREDWEYLKAHPEEVDKIDRALKTFDDSNHDDVMKRLKEKLGQETFDKSVTVGNRGLEERLKDNGDTPGGRTDALVGMSSEERQKYITNKDGFRDKINGLLKSDEERYLADSLSRSQGELTPVQKVLIDGIRGDNPVKTFNDIEEAFQKDPAFRERMNNPQTEDDKKLSAWFHDATRKALDKAGLGDQNYGEGGTVPGRYDEYDKVMFGTGHLPVDLKILLTEDKQLRAQLILNATPDEKARLLSTNPDPETKAFQDRVLGTDKDQREVLLYGLRQEHGFTDADRFREFALGQGVSQEELRDKLAKMTPEQRQNLANEYWTKYHSLITADVIGKVNDADRWRFRELLSPTDVNVRQIALDAQHSNDSHTSGWDKFLTDWWDYTRVSADSTQDQMTRFVAEHSKELEKLTPEQRKQFDDAIANYMEAQKNYIESKGEFAEAFVNATITVAAIGGAFFTGGTSLALLAAIGAGGAAYRIAVMQSIQGSDFDSSAYNILKQGFEGGAAAMLGFLGPEALGIKGVGVGAEIAGTTAGKLVTGAGTKALFREGSEQILKDSLAQLTREGAIIGDRELAAIAERVAADGVDRNVVEQAIRNQLKQDVMTGVRNVVINEADAYVRNMVAAQIGVQGKEILATAAGFESPDTLWERMQGSAISTVAGVTFFHGIIRSATAGREYIKIALGKDAAGNYVAGEGTPIRRADGRVEVVPPGKTMTLGKGDTIAENVSAREGLWGKAAINDKGEIEHFRSSNGEDYSRVPGKPDTWVDPSGKEVNIKDVKIEPDGTFTFTKEGTSYKYDPKTGDYTTVSGNGTKSQFLKDGTLQSIDDPVTHTRVEPQYTTNAQGQPEITGFKRYSVDNAGSKTEIGTIEHRPDGWTAVDKSGNVQQVYGKDVRVNPDGSLTFTGDAQNPIWGNDSFVGQTVFGAKVTEVTIKPNGERIAKITETNGTRTGEIHINSEGHMQSVTDLNGLKTEFQYDAAGKVTKASFDGKEYSWDAGKNAYVDAQGNVFAKDITTFPNSGLVSIDVEPSFRLPGEPNNEITRMYRYPDGKIRVDYANMEDNLRIQDSQKFQARKPEENWNDRLGRGEVTRDPNDANRFVSEDPSGAKVYYDKDGKVLGTDRPDGSKVEYKYAQDGRVQEVTTTAKDGSKEVIRQDGNNGYERVKPDGTVEKLEYNGHPVNDVTVESDGSVTQWNDKFEGIRKEASGLEVKIDRLGFESVDAKFLPAERTRLENMAEKMFGKGEKAERMKDMMREFEANAKKNGVTDAEVAKVYQQINKMLTANDAVMPLAEREVLAQQLMLSLAKPHTIDQGGWNTCNVTAEAQVRLANAHPADLAQMMTDIATKGRFVTHPDGRIIDMTQVKGALTPQPDVAGTMGDPANFKGRNDFSDLDNYAGGQRNFLDQIIQTSLVNERWQSFPPTNNNWAARSADTLDQIRATGVTRQSDFEAAYRQHYRPGDMRYEIQGGRPDAPNARGNLEVVVDYSSNPAGTRVWQPRTTKNGIDPITGKPATIEGQNLVTAPGLYNNDLVHIDYAISGVQDPPHFFFRGDPAQSGYGQVGFDDPVKFAEYLDALKNGKPPAAQPGDRGFPATVFVDANIIQNINPALTAGGGADGAHVMNVTDVWKDPTTGKWMVHVTNQWGEPWDRNMDIDELWRYMDPKAWN